MAADNASEATKRLNSVIDDPATGLKADSMKVNTLITDAGVEAKKTILSAADEVEKAMNDSYEAGKLVAQYRHSDLMLRVILNEPVTDHGAFCPINGDEGSRTLVSIGMSDFQSEFNSLAIKLEMRKNDSGKIGNEARYSSSASVRPCRKRRKTWTRA